MINTTQVQDLIKQTAASLCVEIPAAYQDMVNIYIYIFLHFNRSIWNSNQPVPNMWRVNVIIN